MGESVKTKKVCILSSVHTAFDTRIFYKQAKSLSRAGYPVTYIVPHHSDERIDQIYIKAIQKPTGRFSRMFYTVIRIYREALRQNADIYHFHDPELIPIGLLLKNKNKIVIYDVHEYYKDKIKSKFYIPTLLRNAIAYLFDSFETWASKKFDQIIVTDKVTQSKFHDRVTIISGYPYLPATLKDIHKSDQYHTIIYAGGLTENRGLFKMIEAIHLVQCPVKLLLIGNFYSKSDQKRAMAMPGYKKVQWVRHTRWPEVIKFTARSHIGLALYQPVPAYAYYGENTVKLFEYMMLGLPFITSKLPNLVKLIGNYDCGLLVEPTDAKAIAQAIEHLIIHPEIAKEMGLKGQSAVDEHFNWAHEEKKLLDIYHNLAYN